MTHTPGPWRVGSKTGHNVNLVFASDTENAIAQIYELPLHTTVRELGSDPRWLEGLSNARLVAAAPDLLEALKEIARMGGYQAGIASAAIAKATGGAP